MSWKDSIASVAPTLAAALGGPLAGLAASVAGKILLGKENATADEVKDFVLANQTPEIFLKLKEAENTLTIRLRELDIEADRLNVDDRKSARDRQAKTGDKLPGRLALVVFIGFFGILGAMIGAGYMGIAFPTEVLSPLNIMLGALATLLAQIGNYFYGSSKGSADKQALIDKVMSK